jgi:subtilisin family serine protease
MNSDQQEPDAGIETKGLAAEPQRTDPETDLLLRHASRNLDPTKATRFRNQQLHPTVYGGSRLLLRPTPDENAVITRLKDIAESFGLDVKVNPVDERMRQMAREAGIGPEEPQPLLLRVELVPLEENELVEPPDAWPVLQKFRASYPAGAPERAAVQLDHVLTPHTDSIVGTASWRVPGGYWRVPGGYWKVPGGYWRVPSGNPYLDVPSGIAEYAVPGFGGRAPVAWIGPEPPDRPDYPPEGQRWPVIALLDTEVADHWWFPDETRRKTTPDAIKRNSVVVRRVTCGDDLVIGLPGPDETAEADGNHAGDLTGQLGPTAGHGTFIAGLIRQKCPTATILAVRVIESDGVVAEADLIEALNKLWLRQKLAIISRQSDQLIDVVSMSLGYYHEDSDDLKVDPLLLAPIRALAQLGVVIVASAGNDSTTRPMYPAAFAPHSGGIVPKVMHDELPVVAVGASNPDKTVALFSNAGPWVRACRPGAALVSTMPPIDASGSPSIEYEASGKEPTLRQPRGRTTRATLDPDDFSAGFGVWSGTSFAAPILAAEVAQYLAIRRLLDRDDVDPAKAVDRGWEAVTDRVPSLQRPLPATSYMPEATGYSWQVAQ